MMMFRQNFIALFLCTVSIVATPVAIHSEYAVKDSHSVPDGWKYMGTAPPDHEIELHIALKQAHFDVLEKHLYEGKLSIAQRVFRRIYVAY
jgi:tripeptidyl-peptidase-1